MEFDPELELEDRIQGSTFIDISSGWSGYFGVLSLGFMTEKATTFVHSRGKKRTQTDYS